MAVPQMKVPTKVHQSAASPPSPEVAATAKRRQFSSSQRHRILAVADRCSKTGEIVVTHLATREFPFIRYLTGDVGVLDEEECECGRGLPMLKEIQGRTSDFVVAADGTLMHGLALIYVVRDLPGIEKFKIIQETKHLTRVILVTGPGFTESLIPIIETGFKARLGDDVSVVVERATDIPPEPSGKFRYVVSRVPVP